MRRRLHSLPYRIAKRIVIGVVGGCMLLVGIAMIVLPGPAFIVIPAGLGVLALEFAWARVWLRKIKAAGKNWGGMIFRRNAPRNDGAGDSSTAPSAQPGQPHQPHLVAVPTQASDARAPTDRDAPH